MVHKQRRQELKTFYKMIRVASGYAFQTSNGVRRSKVFRTKLSGVKVLMSDIKTLNEVKPVEPGVFTQGFSDQMNATRELVASSLPTRLPRKKKPTAEEEEMILKKLKGWADDYLLVLEFSSDVVKAMEAGIPHIGLARKGEARIFNRKSYIERLYDIQSISDALDHLLAEKEISSQDHARLLKRARTFGLPKSTRELLDVRMKEIIEEGGIVITIRHPY